jgi:hyperosmotically inducible protein
MNGAKANGIRAKIIGLGAVVLLAAAVGLGAPAPRDQQPVKSVEDRVHRELVTLPYYGVFDNLAFKVDGDTVTLYGQVVRPTTKSDAGARVARIAGVDRVVNNIEVLPLSSFDSGIRSRTYRAVFSRGSLYRYALGANPSIHIIVDNGHVTLEGIVSNKMDSQLAYMAASGVPGVFSVTNNLRTISGS